jgi:hypothetical protein
MQSLPNIPPNAAGNDPTWFFNDFDEGKDKHRDPSAGEFYQEIDNFVREVIQNSLDARANKEGKPVRVLFSWGTLQGWKKDSFLKKCFEELLPHYKAWRKARTPNGDLEGDDVPTDCKFIVVEDFETIGLVGDVKRERVEGGKNHLYDFVRREGSSEKSENDRGRRGLGKQVFLSASQLSTFLFWTVRNDPQLPSLMMGVSTLGVHSVNGKKYHPDGWLVASRPKESDDGKSEFPDPITDPRLIETFRETFQLARNKNLGLSVVIPFVREDVYRKIADKHRLAYRVIKEFYYPILAGQLEVEIKSTTDSRPLRIDSEALRPDLLQLLFEKVCESEAEDESEPEDAETLLEKIEIVREYLATQGHSRASTMTQTTSANACPLTTSSW